MKRMIAAASALALAAGAAGAAERVIVIGPVMSGFEMKRQIVDVVQEQYGEAVVYDDPAETPEDVLARLGPGEPLPEGAEVEPLPKKLADALPRLTGEQRFAKLGNNIVALDGDGTVLMVVLDVLG